MGKGEFVSERRAGFQPSRRGRPRRARLGVHVPSTRRSRSTRASDATPAWRKSYLSLIVRASARDTFHTSRPETCRSGYRRMIASATRRSVLTNAGSRSFTESALSAARTSSSFADSRWYGRTATGTRPVRCVFQEGRARDPWRLPCGGTLSRRDGSPPTTPCPRAWNRTDPTKPRCTRRVRC